MTFNNLRSGKKAFEVEAANEADAVVIGKHQQPLDEGESMSVVFLGRILTANAGNGMPVGQGGGAKKLDATGTES